MGLTRSAVFVTFWLPYSLLFAHYAEPNGMSQDLVRAVPSQSFAAGDLHALMFGDLWREAWTTEVSVEGFAPQGKEEPRYTFRSLRLDPADVFPPDVLKGFSPDLLDDLVAGTYPYADVIVDRLSAALDLPARDSRIAVIPAGSPNGASASENPSRMGILSSAIPADRDTKLCDTPTVLKFAGGNPDERIDVLQVLKIRLMDLLLSSWCDASAQWRWTPTEVQGIRIWKPVEVPHPLAFCRYDGALSIGSRFMVAPLPSFFDDYPDIKDLTWHTRHLDRGLLSSLSRHAFDSLAAFIVRRITDSVMQSAFETIPPERRAADGALLGGLLQSRRADLCRLAEDYYDLLAQTVDIRATTATEWIEVTHHDTARLSVEIYARTPGGARDSTRCSFSRTFLSSETDEVRLYTGGGNDYVHMSGAHMSGVGLRLITDGEVSKPHGGDNPEIFDQDVESEGVDLDEDVLVKKPAASEDRGSSWQFGVMLDYHDEYGPLIGCGPVYYRYGFRAVPYAWMISAIGGYAPVERTGRLRLLLDTRTLITGASFRLSALVSGYEMSSFFGVGNETELEEGRGIEYYRPHLREYRLASSLYLPLSSIVQLGVLGSANYVRADDRADRYVNSIRPYGVDGLGYFGVGAAVQADSRDEPAYPQHGFFFRVGGTMYPATRGLTGPFSRSQCDLRAYFGGSETPALTMAFRMRGEKVWGDVPYFEQANLGGWNALRGLTPGRYIGDALILGTVELRASLWRLNFIVPSTLGVSCFGESGRVFVEGETSYRWHASYGGTVWVAPWSRDNTISVMVAGSKEGVEVYLDFGVGF